jgi:hypothetical protein
MTKKIEHTVWKKLEEMPENRLRTARRPWPIVEPLNNDNTDKNKGTLAD